MTERLFKFLAGGGRPAQGGTGVWSLPAADGPGEWMPAVTGRVVPCRNGYHLCRESDLAWWTTAYLYAAESRGERIDVEGHQSKIVVREARLLHRIETWIEQAITLWACDCAEHVLHIYEQRHTGDDRPRDAIRIARLAALGQASHEEAAGAAGAAEAAWQSERLLAYVDGTVTPEKASS